MPAPGPIHPFLAFLEPFAATARTSTSMTAIQEPPERADDPASAQGCRVPAPIPANALDLASLVQKHQAGVWRYVRFLGADPSEADDLTQETFLALARSEFVERNGRQTAGYLRVVARNQLLALRRKQNREISTVELEAADSVWSAAAGPDGNLAAYLDALRDCVQQLDGRARQAIEMHYKEQAGREVIATRLEMQPDGVKTLLRRTRQVLRECVERKLKDETNL